MPEPAVRPAENVMAARIAAHDWSGTPLGPRDTWSAPLKTVIDLCLGSAFPACLYWGEDPILLYNDHWRLILDERFDVALGQRAEDTMPVNWPEIGARIAEVRASGRGIEIDAAILPVRRNGRTEPAYWDYAISPVEGPEGRIDGFFAIAREVSDRVFAAERRRFMTQLFDRLRPIDRPNAVISAALAQLGTHLDVGRVGFGVVDQAAETYNIHPCWLRGDPDLTDVAGPLPLSAFGELNAVLSAGHGFAIDDMAVDPRVVGTPLAASHVAIGVRSGVGVPVVNNDSYCAMLFVQDNRPRVWLKHHSALLRTVAQVIWREMTRVTAEAALRESEARHRLVFEQARDAILTCDLEQRVVAINPSAATTLGTVPEAMVGHLISEFLPATDFARSNAMLAQKLRDGGTTRYEIDVQTAGGVRRWEVNSVLATDAAGRPVGSHAVARDITERHAFEARQELLIHELNHRVKNTLALVQGLAAQSLRAGSDPVQARQTFERRLAALAAAHDLLSREKWENVLLGDLVADAIRPYAEPAERIMTDGPRVPVPPKAAISLVLALHELGANAARHGALSVPDGHVAMDWRSETGRLRLSWRERGGPPVRPPTTRGFGLRMVERALANDFAAEVSFDFPPDGLVFTLDAPLREETA